MKKRASVFARDDHLVVMSWSGGRPNSFCQVLTADVGDDLLGDQIVEALNWSEKLPPDPPAAVPRHASILGFKSWRTFATGTIEVLIRQRDDTVVELSPARGPKFEPISDGEMEIADWTPASLANAVRTSIGMSKSA